MSIKQYKYGDHEKDGETSLAMSKETQANPSCQKYFKELYSLQKNSAYDAYAMIKCDNGRTALMRLTNAGRTARGRNAFMHALLCSEESGHFVAAMCANVLAQSQTEREATGERVELPDVDFEQIKGAYRSFCEEVDKDSKAKEIAAAAVDAIFRALSEKKRVCLVGTESEVRRTILAALSFIPHPYANELSFITKTHDGHSNDEFIIGTDDESVLKNKKEYIFVSLSKSNPCKDSGHFARFVKTESRAKVMYCFDELAKRGLSYEYIDLVAALNSYNPAASFADKLSILSTLSRSDAFRAECEALLDSLADSVSKGEELLELGKLVTPQRYGKIICRLFSRGVLGSSLSCRNVFLQQITDQRQREEWCRLLISEGGSENHSLSWLIATMFSQPLDVFEAAAEYEKFCAYAGQYFPQFMLFWAVVTLEGIRSELSKGAGKQFGDSLAAEKALLLFREIEANSGDILSCDVEKEQEGSKRKFSKLSADIDEDELVGIVRQLEEKEHSAKLLESMKQEQATYTQNRQKFGIDDLCRFQSHEKNKKKRAAKAITVLLGLLFPIIFGAVGAGVAAALYGVTKYFSLYYLILPVAGAVISIAAYAYSAKNLGRLKVPRRKRHIIFTIIASMLLIAATAAVLFGLTFVMDYIPILKEVL